MNKRGVISLSGGLDSSCLLLRMIAEGYKDILAVTIDYGQSNRIEIERAKSLIQYLSNRGYPIRHRILDLSGLGRLLSSALTDGGEIPEGHYKEEQMKATVIPNRNVIFSSIVYGIAQSIANDTGDEVNIMLGIQQGENSLYPDSRPESRVACEATFRISNYNSHLVNYETPYITYTKANILEDLALSCTFLNVGFDEVLKNTISSYNPDKYGRSSGKSSADIKRLEAFIELGLVDPIEYVDGWHKTVSHAKGVLAEQNS